jgi:hypothetical protein
MCNCKRQKKGRAPSRAAWIRHSYRQGPDPIPLRDVISLDCLCAGSRPPGVLKPTLNASVLVKANRTARETGGFAIISLHSMSFRQLPQCCQTSSRSSKQAGTASSPFSSICNKLLGRWWPRGARQDLGQIPARPLPTTAEPANDVTFSPRCSLIIWRQFLVKKE